MVERRGGSKDTTRRSSFASAALLTYGTQLAGAVLSLGNVLIVSRALGPEGRGDVAFLWTVAWLTANLAMLGVQEANANIGGAEPGARRALATNSIFLSAFFGGASSAVVVGLIAAFPVVGGEVSATLLGLTLGSVPLVILQFYLLFLVQADYGFTLSNAAFLLGPVLNVTINGVFAALGIITVGTAVVTNLAGQILAMLVLAWYLGRRLAGFGRPDLALARRSLSFGVKSHAGRIMLLGNYRLDQWLLGAIAGSRELGLYSVAVAWAEALFYLPTALAAVQRPDLVRAARQDAVRQASALFRASVLVTAFLAIILVIAAPVLCVTVFGDEFGGSIDDLRILAFGALGMVALKQLGSALTAQRLPIHGSAALAVAFVSTVLLDLILIPAHGGLGAALASTLAYTAGGIAVALIFTSALGGRLRDLVPRLREVPEWGRRIRRQFAQVTPIEQESVVAESTLDGP
jgi:O-antigen/teichoic acid export membrane protein